MRRHLPAGLLPVAVTTLAFTAAGPTMSQRYDLEERAGRFDLPRRLKEVSGLAFGPDGTLYAHGDERGIVYRIDVTEERVDRGFQLGSRVISDDFEGLTVAGDRFFLISSRGRLYEFAAVPEGTRAPVRVTNTGLGDDCEIEGLAFHAPTGSLLVACKTLYDRAHEVRVHRIPLDPGRDAGPPLRIPWTAFRPWGHDDEVNPSGLAVDPETGTLLVVAARQGRLFEVDLEGKLLDVFEFPGRRHVQAEGVVVGPDRRLYVADEGDGRDGRITIYDRRAGDGL